MIQRLKLIWLIWIFSIQIAINMNYLKKKKFVIFKSNKNDE